MSLSQSRRGPRWVALLIGLVLVGAVPLLVDWPRADRAVAQDAQDALTGKNVAILFNGQTYTGRFQISGINGKVTGSTAAGLWVESTTRFFTNSTSEKYAGRLFVPWQNVTYVKVLK